MQGIGAVFPGAIKLSCTLHVIQLTIKILLDASVEFIGKLRELIKFFRHPKQEQRLLQAQSDSKSTDNPAEEIEEIEEIEEDEADEFSENTEGEKQKSSPNKFILDCPTR